VSDEKLLTAEEVAQRLSVPPSWVRSNTRSGAIPHVQLGRYQRYEWSAVQEWLGTCAKPGRIVKLRRRGVA
jgi:excisionase family DNA binding protein